MEKEVHLLYLFRWQLNSCDDTFTGLSNRIDFERIILNMNKTH